MHRHVMRREQKAADDRHSRRRRARRSRRAGARGWPCTSPAAVPGISGRSWWAACRLLNRKSGPKNQAFSTMAVRSNTPPAARCSAKERISRTTVPGRRWRAVEAADRCGRRRRPRSATAATPQRMPRPDAPSLRSPRPQRPASAQQVAARCSRPDRSAARPARVVWARTTSRPSGPSAPSARPTSSRLRDRRADRSAARRSDAPDATCR